MTGLRPGAAAEGRVPQLKRQLRELEAQIDRQRTIVRENREAGLPNSRADGLLGGIEALYDHIYREIGRLS